MIKHNKKTKHNCKKRKTQQQKVLFLWLCFLFLLLFFISLLSFSFMQLCFSFLLLCFSFFSQFFFFLWSCFLFLLLCFLICDCILLLYFTFCSCVLILWFWLALQGYRIFSHPWNTTQNIQPTQNPSQGWSVTEKNILRNSFRDTNEPNLPLSGL